MYSPTPATLSGPRRRAGSIDFREIEVETVRAAALASRTLRRRADLGERPPALDRADMDQVVEVSAHSATPAAQC